MMLLFPPMNGPFAKEELPEEEASASDYSIGKQIIYIAFAWSKAEIAYQTVADLAAKHGLGFFNASSPEEEVWLPKSGRLTLAHKKEPPTWMGRLKELLHIDVK